MQKRNTINLKFVSGLLCLALPFQTFAHTINYALEKAPANDVIWYYFKLGVNHIIPYGLDHILFVVSLCLLNTKLKTILWQATAFTVAHTITLALSMKGIIKLPADIIEPLIALSIAFVAIENILLSELKVWRIAIIFMFGLVHGMGFASALNEIGLPRNKFFTSIFSFNVGVEIGQISVISLVFLLIIIPFGKRIWYKKFIVYPLSAIIAMIALYWTFERMA
ncbi:MAG: HupE/UreJ family protein [Bacteroidota bacterium]|nr:HupE/UreJ family protein [Bacteroidota bacterium]MDQ6889637.1 HupE/UreJ family protein [Bacteroidota bacterium]